MSELLKGIRKRGDSYVADVSYRGRRRTGTADTLEEAIVLKAALKSELTGGRVASLPSKRQAAWPLSKAIEVTDQVAWRNTTWGTHARHNVDEFARFVGKGRTLDTIDMVTLDEWVQELQDRGKSDGTINRYLAALSKAFTVAEERGGVRGRPKFPRRKESQGRIRFLTAEEERAFVELLDQWSKADERDLFILLIDTGMRMGEALGLEWRDVDFKSGMISVWQTKNDTPRSVPMTKRVRRVLEYRAGKRTQEQKLLPVSRHSFRQMWDRAKAQLGLSADKQLVPHALRHTCASRLVQRGVPLKVVQEWMGHKSIAVTMRYAHLTPANLMAAVAVLEVDG